jgi:tRNA1(Val) A37 N6-methylase TrmN6
MPAFSNTGFKWDSLPKDGVVVDVGGGAGASSLIIAKAVPHLKIVVQDRAAVLEDAQRVSILL